MSEAVMNQEKQEEPEVKQEAHNKGKTAIAT